MGMSKTEAKIEKISFDPGFGPYVLVFSTTYDYMQREVKKFKNANQRKTKYKFFEGGLMKLCDNLTSFYLGCMLYGAYLKNRFKDAPREITDNDLYGLDIDECRNGDITIEVSSIKTFVENNDKNPFATKKINPKYLSIIKDYEEFLELNNYFTDIKTTDQIKIPSRFSYINKYSEANLDKVLATINEAISAKKIEKLLTSEYFEKIK